MNVVTTDKPGRTTSPAPPKPARKKRKATLAHRAEYYAMRATIGALRAMSWDAACRIGERLGVLGYRPFGIRKRVVEKQIAAAFPELSHADVQELARQSYAHLGRTFVESALFDKLGQQGVLDIADEVEGWHHIDDAITKAKGIVFVT